jgi:rare lipoprotein A
VQSLLQSSAWLRRRAPLEWRLSGGIVIAVLSLISQGCGVISDPTNRAMSTKPVPALEAGVRNSSIQAPQTHSLPREVAPSAQVPPPSEAAPDPLIARLPLPAPPLVVETGVASWYGPRFHGKRTASGEIFNQEKLTAAHRTLPWGSRVRITNLVNGRSVVVEINDRGPAVKGRIIDVSRAAARTLGMVESGTTTVRVEWLADFEKSNDVVWRGR